jgi:hypothetical protein
MKAIGEDLKKIDIREKFKGFVRPNTTPTPDDLFDIFLTQLTHAELKVLLYIIRRTFGFKKDDDRISIRQIAEGITTKRGGQLDKGAGLTKRGAIKALQALEEKGLITVSRAQAPDGNNQINVYRLRFRE